MSPRNEKGKTVMKKYLVLAVFAAAVVFPGCKGGKPAVPAVNGKITNVETYTVAPRNFAEYITLPVVVNPYREVNLGLVNGGKVERILADKGDRVAAGKVLLETETVVLEAALDLAKANLDFQKGEYGRNKNLFDSGNISPAVFDGVALALAQAQSQYDIAKKQLDNATLAAPFGGVITERHAEVGDVLGPGTTAFKLIDVDRVKVQAGIPEKYIFDFKPGNRVYIRFDAIPGKEFEGKINYVAPEASASIRTFLAEILVDNRGGIIKAGIMGDAQILKKDHPDAVMIPLNAVIQTQSGRIAFVLKSDGTAEERKIEIGPSSDVVIMILKGIDPGDRVIVKGQHQIANGEKVKVVGKTDDRGVEGTGR
jgi:membrane fusion protein, multidrug efflux system